MDITEILVPSQQIIWFPWAVQYFAYIGSAYAAAILFLISYIFKDHTSHYFRSALVLVFAIGGIVGPLALTGDLHQPARSWHFFANLTPWSWMSLGSIFLPAFSAITVATAWLYLRKDLNSFKSNKNFLLQKLSLLTLGEWTTPPKLMLTAAILCVLSGLSISIYTGAEVSILASRPLWNQLPLPLIWFFTAFIGAIGSACLMLILFPKVEDKAMLVDGDIKIMKITLLFGGVLAFILLPIWASNNPSFDLYTNEDWIPRLAILSFSFLICSLLAFFAEGLHSLNRVKLFYVSSISIFSFFYLRWVMIMDVQQIPKFDIGPYPYELPLGSNGLLGMVGIAGLWFAIALFGSEIVQPENDEPQLN